MNRTAYVIITVDTRGRLPGVVAADIYSERNPTQMGSRHLVQAEYFSTEGKDFEEAMDRAVEEIQKDSRHEWLRRFFSNKVFPGRGGA